MSLDRLGRAEVALAETRKALAELVRLKDLKAAGDTGWTQTEKEVAWSLARAVLDDGRN